MIKKINRELIDIISNDKNEDIWVKEKRIESLFVLEKINFPNFGPDLSVLDLENINYYKLKNLEEGNNWDNLPEDVVDTFDQLGILDAEKKYLGGVGAQYDSNMVYHRIQDGLKKQGIIFENMDRAVELYPELVKKYFMTDCIKQTDHYFAALHGAVWSGGTFIYVPKGVKVNMPLQAYFRMNEVSGGQFEHTLIIAEEDSEITYIEGCSAPRYNYSSLHAGGVEIFVHKNAKVKYISIENWSKNTYNLNTKKAIVYEGGSITWISGNMGSNTTMLYPTSVLIGDNSTSDSLSVVFSDHDQNQDVGSKVIHIGKNTKSKVVSKSIVLDDGVSTYRGYIEMGKNAHNSESYTKCDTLILSDTGVSNTYPLSNIKNNNCITNHEATVGNIDNEYIYYLMSYGIKKNECERMIVLGYLHDIAEVLPIEYAIEFNKLVELEMDK